MNLTRFIRGYDRRTERLIEEYAVSDSLFASVRGLIQSTPDDPDFLDPYEIPAVSLRQLNIPCESQMLVYYLEAEADPRHVAMARDALRSVA
jgi:hypothetical protein